MNTAQPRLSHALEQLPSILNSGMHDVAWSGDNPLHAKLLIQLTTWDCHVAQIFLKAQHTQTCICLSKTHLHDSFFNKLFLDQIKHSVMHPCFSRFDNLTETMLPAQASQDARGRSQSPSSALRHSGASCQARCGTSVCPDKAIAECCVFFVPDHFFRKTENAVVPIHCRTREMKGRKHFSLLQQNHDEILCPLQRSFLFANKMSRQHQSFCTLKPTRTQCITQEHFTSLLCFSDNGFFALSLVCCRHSGALAFPPCNSETRGVCSVDFAASSTMKQASL